MVSSKGIKDRATLNGQIPTLRQQSSGFKFTHVALVNVYCRHKRSMKISLLCLLALSRGERVLVADDPGANIR